MATIICLGNRFVPGDDAGCRVFDYLKDAAPDGLEIIDGGLCGLDLLRMVEGRRRVVFVDTVAGMAKKPGDIVVMDREQVAAYASSYGHGAGLPYLMSLLPEVCAEPPEITLVGVEGIADGSAIRALAIRSIEVANHGAS